MAYRPRRSVIFRLSFCVTQAIRSKIFLATALVIIIVSSFMLRHSQLTGTALLSSTGGQFHVDVKQVNSSKAPASSVPGPASSVPGAAVILVLDSTRFNSNQNSTRVVYDWLDSDVTLRECGGCVVTVLYYADDVMFKSPTFQDGVGRRLNRTLIGGRVTMTSVERRGEEATVLIDSVKLSYVSGCKYILVVFPPMFSVPLTAGSGLWQLRSYLQKHSQPDVGVTFLQVLDSEQVKSQPVGGSSAEFSVQSLGAVLISHFHVEILGDMFPFQLKTINTSIGHLSRVYPASLKTVLRLPNTPGHSADWSVVAQADDSSAGASNKNEPLRDEIETLNVYLEAIRQTKCLRCDIKQSRRVIAMSLYGSSTRYTYGAIRNAQLLPVLFPKWRLWFYTEQPDSDGKTTTEKVPAEVVARLEELGAEMKYIDRKKTGLAPMLWRFLVAEEDDVDEFTVRDSDSRLTSRDAAVVADWLKTDKAFHCIRDHPSHSIYSISGGLWGGRPVKLKKLFNGTLRNEMKGYGAGYVEDMSFLGAKVWPKVKDKDAYCHDSFSCKKYQSSYPFPVKRKGGEHLGEVYDQYSIGRQGDINILVSAGVNKDCVPAS